MDRGKLGTKRHVLTDKKNKGIPLSAVVITEAANTHDVKAAIEILDSIGTKRRPTKNKLKKKQQNLCLYKRGYYSAAEIEREVVKRRYIPHIRRRGEKKVSTIVEKKKRGRRRWVVERTNSWHNRFRKLLTRYEKKSDNYLGLVQLACCMIIYMRILLGCSNSAYLPF